MKISIITATYNSAKTVRDTLESVLSQTFKDYEYIIKDGGSKDGTLDIVREYEPKFEGRMRIISERDKGIYDAMNKGIEASTGDVVGILNSDDFYYSNDVFEKINDAFERGAEAVCGNLVFVDSEDTDKIVRTWKGSPYRSFKKGWHPAHPTFYVKKEFYDKYGLYDTNFAVSADFELMLRFIEKYQIKIVYLNFNFIRMREGGESTGSIKRIIKGNKNVMKAFKKNGIPVSIFYPVIRLVPKFINKIQNRTK